MPGRVWTENGQEFKTVENEILNVVRVNKPEPTLTVVNKLETELDNFLNDVDKDGLWILSGLSVIEKLQDLEPLEVRTDFEVLDYKLKPWQIERNYAYLDAKGITYEIGEVLNAFNVISAIPILLKINDILVRRYYRDMHPCQTMEEFLDDLKAHPGARVNWDQIGD